MTHVAITEERRIALSLRRLLYSRRRTIVSHGYGLMYRLEDLRNSVTAESSLSIDILITWRCLSLDHSQPSTILTAVVLLLHQEIELVQPVEGRTIVLCVVL